MHSELFCSLEREGDKGGMANMEGRITHTFTLHLHLCIWQMLLSKATYIAFQGTHLHSYQFLLSLGIEPMTLALQAPGKLSIAHTVLYSGNGLLNVLHTNKTWLFWKLITERFFVEPQMFFLLHLCTLKKCWVVSTHIDKPNR